MTLHNDVTTLYESFACVDEIIQLLASRATKAESENKELRAELGIINAANVALHGALEQTEAKHKANGDNVEHWFNSNPTPQILP